MPILAQAGVTTVKALGQEGLGCVEGMDRSQDEKEDSGIGCEMILDRAKIKSCDFPDNSENHGKFASRGGE